MKRVFALVSPFLVLFLATLCASAIVYSAALVFGDSVSFRTVFKKSTQFFLVLSIFPLMHWLKLNRFDIGFLPRQPFLKQLAQGFGLGFITLFPVLTVIFALDVHLVDETKPWTAIWAGTKMGLELLLALLIAFVEEPIFRGILLTGFSKHFSRITAIVASAFFYAALHFLNSNIEIPSQDVELWSGFILLRDAFAQMLNPHYLSPFFSLLAVGIFLGVLKTRTPGSLGICIGCHAAWVWQIKLSKLFFNVNPDSSYLYLVSGYDGVIGPMVTVWLLLATVLLIQYRRINNVPPHGIINKHG